MSLTVNSMTPERVAAFARKLPQRSTIFVCPDDAQVAAEGVALAGRDGDVDVQPDPAIPAGSALGKSHYALAVGDSGWWMDD